MNFEHIHYLLILAFVFCSKIIRGDNSEEAKKWHIFGETLHYIEVEQKVNKKENLFVYWVRPVRLGQIGAIALISQSSLE